MYDVPPPDTHSSHTWLYILIFIVFILSIGGLIFAGYVYRQQEITVGPTGATGKTGAIGATGAVGQTGAPGLPNANVSAYAYRYNQIEEYGKIIVPGLSIIPLPGEGPIYGEGIQYTNNGILVSEGIYDIRFNIYNISTEVENEEYIIRLFADTYIIQSIYVSNNQLSYSGITYIPREMLITLHNGMGRELHLDGVLLANLSIYRLA